jgi:predicted ATPase
MPLEKPNFFVITGGPGAGKTTLIEHLRRGGEACIDETARAVIREQAASGGAALPWGDPVAYWETVSRRDLAIFDSLIDEPRSVFFDRGLVDCLAWALVAGFKPDRQLTAALKARRSNRRVFVAPPWAEIYETDAERRQDFAEAVRTYEIIVLALVELGYQPVELPRASVEERAAFVLEVASSAQVSTKARSRT